MRARTAFVPHDLTAPIPGASGGPLAGLTAAVKDMYDIKGMRTGGGSPHWLAAQQPAQKNAAAVQRLLDAGTTIIGKTICEELFYSVAGANAHYGTPLNPRAPGRLPGGSSSGSASAAASGACDIALGSDTGGSMRIPAALCGLYGIRPTHGRVDLTGAMAMAPSFDVAGWFAAGPGAFRKVGGVLLDGARVDAPLGKLVVLDDAFAEADERVTNLLMAAIVGMADDLPPASHDRIAPAGLADWQATLRVVQAHEVWRTYGDFITRTNPALGPGIAERMQYAASVSDDEAAKARNAHERARAHIRARVPPGTILALPSAPSIAPKTDASASEQDAFRTRVMQLISIATLSGLPQITIPIGLVDGCPIGLSFIGWAGGDEALLNLSVRLARFCGFDA